MGPHKMFSPSLIARVSKIAVVCAVAFLLTLIVFGNVTDHGTNLAFIQHVLAMDTTFPFATIRYRAITSPTVQHAAYLFIILIEIVAATLCWIGAWRMFGQRRASAIGFSRAKSSAIAGLTLTYLLWQVGIFAIGNEWFGMWMSKEWSGTDSVFRFIVMTLGALIYVVLPEPQFEEAHRIS